MALEVERKFLLTEPPAWLDECPSLAIEQGYLAVGEGAEVRLRRAGERRTLTVKRGEGEVREEVEVELSPAQFDALWPLTDSHRVAKTRYRKSIEAELEAEVDVYSGHLEGLVLAEVEFPSEERSRAFEPPAWLADEVTGDQRYANHTLALNGERRPSQSFRLKRREPVADGLRRVGRGRAEKALLALRNPEGDRSEAIHSARKELKKLRAVLRLCRDELGEETFRRENERFRDAGRLLSSSRDAGVKLETLTALQQRFGVDFPGGVLGPWALALEGERDEVLRADQNGRAPKEEQAMEAIEAGCAAIADWPLHREGWKAVGPGLTRSYRRGRKRLQQTLAEPSTESVHEWRKRAKDLTYQLRVVRDAQRVVLAEMADETKQLTDLLGDHHDLALLAEDLGGRDLGRRAELAALIGRRQSELLDDALDLGQRLYAEKPRKFKRRLKTYWREWRGN